MDTFYLGARPSPSLTKILEKAGHRIVHASYKKGVLGSVSTCVAVVLHWKSKRDQRIIEKAKSIGMPVMVITARLAAALQAGEPQADLYLEEPANPNEVAALLIDLVTARPNSGAATAAAAQKACQ